MPTGNLFLAATMLFSGTSATKVIRTRYSDIFLVDIQQTAVCIPDTSSIQGLGDETRSPFERSQREDCGYRY